MCQFRLPYKSSNENRLAKDTRHFWNKFFWDFAIMWHWSHSQVTVTYDTTSGDYLTLFHSKTPRFNFTQTKIKVCELNHHNSDVIWPKKVWGWYCFASRETNQRVLNFWEDHYCSEEIPTTLFRYLFSAGVLAKEMIIYIPVRE